MINERDRHISRRILARVLLFCSAQSGAVLRFSARGNDDEHDGGIRNRGRRYLAYLLRADDAIAEPPRKSRIVWPQLRTGRRQLYRRRRLEHLQLVWRRQLRVR